MAVGANIKYKNQQQLRSEFWRLMNMRRTGPGLAKRRYCYKAGVPANNTAADNPNKLGDICIDTTNGDIYVCTAFSSDASATTWVKITP